MLKVVLTSRADASLADIVDYYPMEHSASRAQKVIQSLDEAFEKIAKRPFSFPVNFDLILPQENIRQIIVHNTFKVIYRVEAGEIQIIEIFHGRRNERLLKNIK